jgi:hypothetical protein
MTASSFPHRIALDADDYAARHVGRLADGRQAFITEPFVPAHRDEPGREFFATYIFDAEGTLVTAHIDDLGPRAEVDLEHARRVLAGRLAELGPLTPGRIEFWPFEIETLGVTFGMVPRPPDDETEARDFDNWWVEAQPGNYMAFHTPWDSGEYDT